MPEAGADWTLPEGVLRETYVVGIERFLLQSALEQTGGVQTRGRADLLGISCHPFRHLMEKYAL